MRTDWWRGALYLALGGIEWCWVYTVLLLANQHALGGRLSLIGLMLVYPASFGFNWLLRQARWHPVLQQAASWAGWAAALLLSVKLQLHYALEWSDITWLGAIPQSIGNIFYGFRPELLIILASIVLWWLGRRLAWLRLGFAVTVGEFQFGLAVLVLAFFSAAELQVEIGTALPTALAFFVFSLAGISIAHAQEGAGWLSGRSRRHWSVLLIASICLVTALGWLIGLMVTPDLLAVILGGFKWLWGLFLKVLAFIASLFPVPEPGAMPTPSPLPGMGSTPEDSGVFSLPEDLRQKLQIAWMVLITGALAFALWRISSDIFAWLRRKLAGMSGAELEPMPGAFRADLLGLFRFLILKLLNPLLRFRHKSKPTVPEVASARQLYRQFLRWAGANGYRRAVWQTPHEFLDVLSRAVPEARVELDLITEHYVRVRYSPSPPDRAELSDMKQTWQDLRKRRLKKVNNDTRGA